MTSLEDVVACRPKIALLFILSIAASLMSKQAAAQVTAADITDLILVTGQSNVQGSLTSYDPSLDSGHPRIFAYTSNNDWEVADLRQAWDMNGWHPGNGALTEADKTPYNNFAMHFAKKIVADDPDRVVGFIIASAPGEGIAHWDANGTFYPLLESKVLAAINAQGVKSQIDGILWHQGETDWLLEGTSDPDITDAETNYYPNKLAALIARFRTENWFSSDKPFLCGETRQADLNTHLMALNNDGDAWTGCVQGSDLDTREQQLDLDPPELGTHFNSASLRTLGNRYGAKYLEMTQSPQNNDDDVREQAVSEIIKGLENYAATNGSYTVSGTGHRDDGQGWFHYDKGTYNNTIYSGISQYLNYIPADPLHTDIYNFSNNDFMVYRCQDRIGVFAKTDSLLTDTSHSDWWSLNNCPLIPVTIYQHTYFQISQPLSSVIDDSTFDQDRQIAVTSIVSALEGYAADNGTYLVSGHGHNGNGQGWFHYNQGTYPASLFSGITQYLTSIPADPLHTDLNKFSFNDFMTFNCKDRIAVFAKTDSLDPLPADQSWWIDNNCPTFPITSYQHNYYQISLPLSSVVGHSLDNQRQTAVSDIVNALNAYKADFGSFIVTGFGHNGDGQGWFHYSQGTYTDSIFNGLAPYLSSVPADPLHYDVSRFSPNDFMIFRCKDRIAVFTNSDSLQPSEENMDWWLDNNCPTFPIDSYGKNFFSIAY